MRFSMIGALILSFSLHAWVQSAERLIPQKPSARVSVDNDFASDPNRLAALRPPVCGEFIFCRRQETTVECWHQFLRVLGE
jgi:hypothetical protein